MRAFWADLWRRRWFRWTFTPVASIALSWICICLILNYVGESRWQKVKSRVEAEGETLDYFALQPPPIPDEQNFCAIEPLNGIRAFRGSSAASALGKTKRDALKAQTDFFSRDMAIAFFEDPLSGGGMPDETAIFKVFSERPLRSVGLPPLPGKLTSSISWPEIRLEMEKHAPILLELCQAVRQRPRAEFLPRLDKLEHPEVLIAIELPHLNSVQDLANLCRAYSMICLKCGDVRSSLDAALVLLRLGGAVDLNSSAIGNLVAMTHYGRFFAMAWHHLEGRHLDESALALIQDELTRVDLVTSHLASLRAEMAMAVNFSDQLQANPVQFLDEFHMLAGIYSAPSFVDRSLPVLLVCIPDGFYILNKASSIDLQYAHLIHPLKENGVQGMNEKLVRLESLMKAALWQRPDLLMAKMVVPTFSTIQRGLILRENQRRQTLLALALERHFLRHGIYPATLKALDPQFSHGLSFLDIDGEPMRYTITSAGRFSLWSPGPDKVDDGGNFGRDFSPRPKSPDSPLYKGDWVWRYEPATKAP